MVKKLSSSKSTSKSTSSASSSTSRPVCPRCSSKRMTVHGYRFVRGSRRPRYQCQECGRLYVPGATIGLCQGGKQASAKPKKKGR